LFCQGTDNPLAIRHSVRAVRRGRYAAQDSSARGDYDGIDAGERFQVKRIVVTGGDG